MKIIGKTTLYIVLLFNFSFTVGAAEGDCIHSLEALEAQIQRDLKKVNFPCDHAWILGNEQETNDILDVAIIGGGMSGMTSAFALMKEGITHIKIFDENDRDLEGPWMRCARMNMLRSSKFYMGPAMGIPSLTFHAWYEAQYGEEYWNQLKSIPRKLWQKYLSWFRDVLKLPVENCRQLTLVEPRGNVLELTFQTNGQTIVYYARKLVLATGREGCGCFEVPEQFKTLSKEHYAHTGEQIDASFFKDKRIVIIGAGASGFDAAGTALENGALSVEMIARRHTLPAGRKFSEFAHPGSVHGFYSLPDEMRCRFFAECLLEGTPPPKEAEERVRGYDNFHVHFGTPITKVSQEGEVVVIETGKKQFEADFVVCATGYQVDVMKRKELEQIAPYILLWKDKIPEDLAKKAPKLSAFPYLGSHFQFLEITEGEAPFLKNIYCFNYGAFLSHGMLSSDIPLISVGATHLAEGIASDFFTENPQLYFERMMSSQ